MNSGPRGPITAIAITRRGAELARRVCVALPGVHALVPERFALARDERYTSSVRQAIASSFPTSQGLVLIMATGIAVRLLAPLLQDKMTDPAIVVVDDAGRFAISLLAGHLGGANYLAERVAVAIGATAVITTASEGARVPSPDLIGRERGWRIEPESDLTAVAAALVNGDPVGIVQECGHPDALLRLPEHARSYPTVTALLTAGPAAAIIVSDRRDLPLAMAMPAVVYRPPVLVLGAGASRGAPAEELIALAQYALAEGGFAQRSVGIVATIDKKRDEAGILALAEYLEVPLRFFTAEELERAPGDWRRSAIVRRAVGTAGVCEPAAMLAAGGETLAVRKCKSAHATVAIARREGL